MVSLMQRRRAMMLKGNKPNQGWTYNIGDLTKTGGTCATESKATCKMILSINGNNTPNRRSFFVDSGDTSIAVSTTTSSTTVGSQTSAYYPIPVPPTANKMVVSVTPSSQYVQLLVRKLTSGVYSTYTTNGATGYNAGSITRTFTPSDNLYIFVTTKYNSAGTSYPTEPTGLDVVFSVV